jgi:pyrimidine-specific ribonucleoside hydrolase
MNRIPVILDVDTGLDDALAILLASDLPQLQLLGIACVSGNAPVENTYANTRHVVKQLDLKMPIAKGAAYPLSNKILHAHEVHGSSGLGTFKIEPEFDKHVIPASRLYEKLLSESEEPVTIIATGPLTNLAHVIQNHPENSKRRSKPSVSWAALWVSAMRLTMRNSMPILIRKPLISF